MKTKKRNQRPLLLILLLVSGLFLNACTIGNGRMIRGDGNVVTATHEIAAFNNIDIQGMFEVVLEPEKGQPLTLETDENLHELIKIRVKNNTLYVSTTKEGIYRPTKMTLTIPYSQLENITIGGACKLSSDSPVVTSKLAFRISGAADIDLDIEVTSLNTRVSGAASINLRGTADQHTASLSGASNIRAEKLHTKNTNISLSGAGSAHIHASDHLDASLSGVGTIRYYGDPHTTRIDRSGLGSIKSAS